MKSEPTDVREEAVVSQIQARNKRVELDKAWETSKTRRGIIALVTYVVASGFLYLIADSNPFVHALVPVGGYLLSTWSLSWAKQWWVQRQHD